MSIPFNQKFGLTVSFATLLFIGLANTHLRAQSKTQQLSQQHTATQNLSHTQQQNSALLQQQIPSASSQENAFIVQQTSDNNLDKQNTRLSEPKSAPTSTYYQVIDELQKYKFSVQGNQVFTSGKLPTTKVNFNQSDLLTVLVNTRKYYQDYASEDQKVLRTGVLATQGVSVEDILKTLDFMITVLQEDIANNRATRLQDPNFINTNFRVIKWSAYNSPSSTSQKQLRITKYAVFTHPASHKKTSKYNIPIYSLKDNSIAEKFYTKYTKQDVLSGIYESGGKEFGKVEPLAYLTREGFEEALMEGTILLNFTDGSKALFNVDRSNEMPYLRGVAATSQKRYWYFRQVDDIKGYGYKIDAKISIKPGVTFAGDVLNIGLGRVIVLEYPKDGRKQLQLGVLADTGGAFLPNLHQLDFLAGIFQGRKDFGQHTRQLPEYATAYILVKK
ncbi:hypothetical protein [Brasilonema bromeliae]|uniref:POLO box domain-containing protein n=1 Tax=Brasilonema bromeliae SPC951 TaxID=385972 RepID=A0ABX1P1P3_9CYAN|nr:hypothetical protein [Brasilonema bromeliae]NMG18214.1 hypothetical protein [Brasilonema bromeliae SPC951]